MINKDGYFVTGFSAQISGILFRIIGEATQILFFENVLNKPQIDLEACDLVKIVRAKFHIGHRYIEPHQFARFLV